MGTPYKLLTDEQQQIIRDRNLKYYYDNKEKIRERTKIYFKEYYHKNHLKMILRQRNYTRRKYFSRVNIENVNIKPKEKETLTVSFN